MQARELSRLLGAADDNARFDGVSDAIEGNRQGLALYARHDGEAGFVQGYAYLEDE